MGKVRCVIQRGGTSKGVFFRAEDLPCDESERKRIILRAFGSPDKRQIDGLGGADALTSKAAIIGKSTKDGCDVDYTFCQVSIDTPQVFTKGICGNITSGVGPFAIDEGLVSPVEPETTVRIFNTNTKRIILARVPVREGKALYEGDYVIAGVPGTGARISLDFSDSAGAITGNLFPTGRLRDVIDVEGIGKLEVSVVDCCQVQVFVRPEDIGLTGLERPADIDGDPALLERLEMIRGTVAAMIGLCERPEDARYVTGNSPHLVLPHVPVSYSSYLDDAAVEADAIDVMARMMFMQKTHKTYAGTGAMCTAVASLIPGTIIHEYCRKEAAQKGVVRIGHPAGVMEIEAKVGTQNGVPTVRKVGISRTSRRIMEGYVYV